MRTVSHTYKKLILFIGMIAAMLVRDHISGWSAVLDRTGNLNFLRRMAEENLVNAVFLHAVVIIVGCVALTLPGVIFVILAGLFFRPVLGTICCSLAITIGTMAAFLAGRFFPKDSIRPVAMKNRYLKEWPSGEADKNELFILMITRLVPLFPYSLRNFTYGVTDTSFSTYSIFLLIFMLPGMTIYTIGTPGLADKESRVPYISIAVVLTIIVVGMGMFLRKKYVVQSGRMEEVNEQES